MTEPRLDPGPGSGTPGPRLERAPGERYPAPAGTNPASAADAATGAGPRRATARALLAAGAAALGGAVLFLGIGLVDIGAGTLAAAAAVGWAVALALIWGGDGAGIPGRPARMAVAGGFAAGAVVLGLLLGWVWARAEGGVLPPLENLDQRYGPLAWLDVVVAAGVAAWRAR